MSDGYSLIELRILNALKRWLFFSILEIDRQFTSYIYNSVYRAIVYNEQYVQIESKICSVNEFRIARASGIDKDHQWQWHRENISRVNQSP